MHPEDLETVFHCGHEQEPQYHWFAFDKPVAHLLNGDPTQEPIFGRFVALCSSCRALLLGVQDSTDIAPEDLRALIRGVGTFRARQGAVSHAR